MATSHNTTAHSCVTLRLAAQLHNTASAPPGCVVQHSRPSLRRAAHGCVSCHSSPSLRRATHGRVSHHGSPWLPLAARGCVALHSSPQLQHGCTTLRLAAPDCSSCPTQPPTASRITWQHLTSCQHMAASRLTQHPAAFRSTWRRRTSHRPTAVVAASQYVAALRRMVARGCVSSQPRAASCLPTARRYAAASCSTWLRLMSPQHPAASRIIWPHLSPCQHMAASSPPVAASRLIAAPRYISQHLAASHNTPAHSCGRCVSARCRVAPHGRAWLRLATRGCGLHESSTRLAARACPLAHLTLLSVLWHHTPA